MVEGTQKLQQDEDEKRGNALRKVWDDSDKDFMPDSFLPDSSMQDSSMQYSSMQYSSMPGSSMGDSSMGDSSMEIIHGRTQPCTRMLKLHVR